MYNFKNDIIHRSLLALYLFEKVIDSCHLEFWHFVTKVAIIIPREGKRFHSQGIIWPSAFCIHPWMQYVVSAHYLFCGTFFYGPWKGFSTGRRGSFDGSLSHRFAGKSTYEKSGKKYLTRISRKKKNKNRCAYDIVTFGTNIVKRKVVNGKR